MTKGIIARDADGVLLDFGVAYAGAWQKAFGAYPDERDPLAYWPIDRWEVERVEGDRLDLLRRAFDNEFWSSIPPVPGAVEACHSLAMAGYELVGRPPVRTLARNDDHLEAKKRNRYRLHEKQRRPRNWTTRKSLIYMGMVLPNRYK